VRLAWRWGAAGLVGSGGWGLGVFSFFCLLWFSAFWPSLAGWFLVLVPLCNEVSFICFKKEKKKKVVVFEGSKNKENE
jgi:hypothetical protein